jgi:hypothetical protein
MLQSKQNGSRNKKGKKEDKKKVTQGLLTK